MYIYIYIRKILFFTDVVIEGDPKALFSIATTLTCREGYWDFPNFIW